MNAVDLPIPGLRGPDEFSLDNLAERYKRPLSLGPLKDSEGSRNSVTQTTVASLFVKSDDGHGSCRANDVRLLLKPEGL